jgi:hypothetical protein
MLVILGAAFSPGGDGGRKSPERPAQFAHVFFAAASDWQCSIVRGRYRISTIGVNEI